MRLIDADALIKKLKSMSSDNDVRNNSHQFTYKELAYIVCNQPTAYDENAIIAYGTECYKKGREEWIEKVVTELDNAESVKVFGSLNSGNRLIPVKDAISIVRKGGVK